MVNRFQEHILDNTPLLPFGPLSTGLFWTPTQISFHWLLCEAHQNSFAVKTVKSTLVESVARFSFRTLKQEHEGKIVFGDHHENSSCEFVNKALRNIMFEFLWHYQAFECLGFACFLQECNPTALK